MNDPTFRNITRLFVLFVKNGDGDPTINPFDESYMPLQVKIQRFLKKLSINYVLTGSNNTHKKNSQEKIKVQQCFL